MRIKFVNVPLLIEDLEELKRRTKQKYNSHAVQVAVLYVIGKIETLEQPTHKRRGRPPKYLVGD